MGRPKLFYGLNCDLNQYMYTIAISLVVGIAFACAVSVELPILF
jgi:hypothetical protein